MYKLIPETRSMRKTTWWGIFFGVFPDFFAFTPVFFYVFYNWIFKHKALVFGPPEDGRIMPLNDLSHQLYNYSHSFVIWLIVVGVVWFAYRRFPWILLGWALHIGIDIFSHSSEFYPTPFLFPISNFQVNGNSWGEPLFMTINYGLLLVFYTFIVPWLIRKSSNIQA